MKSIWHLWEENKNKLERADEQKQKDKIFSKNT